MKVTRYNVVYFEVSTLVLGNVKKKVYSPLYQFTCNAILCLKFVHYFTAGIWEVKIYCAQMVVFLCEAGQATFESIP